MSAVTIPTVDVSQFSGVRDAFVEELGLAYEEFGFVGVIGHGIDQSAIDAAYDALHNFFSLPQTTKDSYASAYAGARGYTGFGIETAKDSNHPDLKEFWQVGREVDERAQVHASLLPNVWPQEVPGFRASLYGLFEALDELGNRLLAAIALYLDLPAEYFRDKMNVGNSILRPLHYPPIPSQDTLSLRSAPHEDINMLTLLVGSEEPGLEVLSRSGDWIPVTNPPGTVVANIGDMLQRFTNHVLPSTTHRVVNSPEAFTGQSRYSIPFFCHPNPDFQIDPLPSCVTADNPNRYPEPITADEYLTQRLIEIGLLEKDA
ncbi:MAG: 2-oxoglutarate and iron-dependent oxygenase domain-containing protein [Pseudomonadota bacterium]